MHGPRAFEKIFGSGYVTYFGRASSFLISGFVAAHCSGPPGAYRWTLGAERLTLVPTDEECWIRRAVLATRPWVRS